MQRLDMACEALIAAECELRSAIGEIGLDGFLELARDRAGWTWSELGRRTGATRQTFHNIVRGKTGLTERLLMRLAEAIVMPKEGKA